MTLNTCLRVCILSVLSRKKVFLLPVYRRKVNKKMRMLLAMSKAEIIALSEESFRVYKGCLPNKVHYVKAGVDTVQFTEIESKQRKTLREKFGYSDTDTIVLHTGHMVEARNIRKLMDLDKSFRIILIISTSTRWDENLYNDLKQCPNIKIIHKYIPKIEEYFQIADVYYFPVEEVGCVDVPLSVLEAAACGTPVVTTPYGELKAFKETKSFRFINDFAESNFLIESVKECRENNNRNQILEYDWNHVVERLPGKIAVFPRVYFSAFDLDNDHEIATTETCTIHHYTGSWNDATLRKKKIKRSLVKLMGPKAYVALKKFVKSFIIR